VPEPVIGWLFEVVGIGVWFAVAVYYVLRVVRERTVPIGAMVFVGATTMFWQEWYADWSAYLLYNPKFALIPWDSTWWTTPNKPWAVVAGYGWFIGLSLPALAALCIRRAGAGPVTFTGVFLVVLPIYWAFDMIIEFPATRAHWWTYADPAPLAVTNEEGGFSFIWPILPFAFWAVVAVWLLARRDDRGFMWHERVMRVSAVQPGASRETARVGAMVVMLNASYLFAFVLPLCLIRALLLHDSSVVP
jgi:hypothetical protein